MRTKHQYFHVIFSGKKFANNITSQNAIRTGYKNFTHTLLFFAKILLFAVKYEGTNYNHRTVIPTNAEESNKIVSVIQLRFLDSFR